MSVSIGDLRRIAAGERLGAGERISPVPPASPVLPALPAPSSPLPVLPSLGELLPRGLARGSVISVPGTGLLPLALLAGVSADGAWAGIAGMPEAGLAAAAATGLALDRVLLVPDPGDGWLPVVTSLLDCCEIVLVRPPAVSAAGPVPAGSPLAGSPLAGSPPAGSPPAGSPPAGSAPGPAIGGQIRRRLQATLRRSGGVLVVAGDWPGAAARIRVRARGWSGLGEGRGLLRSCCALVTVTGRGELARAGGRSQWLWLPGPDGTVSAADEAPGEVPGEVPGGAPGGHGERMAG